MNLASRGYELTVRRVVMPVVMRFARPSGDSGKPTDYHRSAAFGPSSPASPCASCLPFYGRSTKSSAASVVALVAIILLFCARPPPPPPIGTDGPNKTVLR